MIHIFTVLIVLVVSSVHSIKQGSYAELSSDHCNTGDILLTISLFLKKNDKVLVQSDGRYFPKSRCKGDMIIAMNGARISSSCLMEWSRSMTPAQHSYNTIGFEEITTDGIYNFTLTAEYIDGFYCVGAGSNLIVFVNPASSIKKASLQLDSSVFSFPTPTVTGRPVGHTPVVTINGLDRSEAVISLAQGYAYQAGLEGDAMMGLYFDGQHLGNNVSMWTVNDIFRGAELIAPMYTHGFASDVETVSFDASALPWDFAPDPVQYRVGASTSLIVMQGGMQVFGAAFTSTKKDHWWDWICVGSNVGWPECPPTDGSGTVLAESTIDIPEGHSGLLMIVAKTRIQADDKDTGGTALLRIELDGQQVGSTGVQQLTHPHCVSSRTMTASYLATGLTPGKHTLRAIGAAIGSFKHISTCRDLPLVWFD